MKIRNTYILAVTSASLLASAAMSQAQSAGTFAEVGLTADAANSSTGGWSTSVANTLSDPFAYDPSNPTSPRAEQVNVLGNGFHGDGSTATKTLSYLLSSGGLTTAGATSFYLDFYGRDGLPSAFYRDNDYTVTLFNGDYSTQVAQLAGQGVPDASPAFNRSTFNLGDGVTFDRMQITSNVDSFSVMEVRAATSAVPEPSAALLGGLGALALLRRRRA